MQPVALSDQLPNGSHRPNVDGYGYGEEGDTSELHGLSIHVAKDIINLADAEMESEFFVVVVSLPGH